MDKSKMKQTTIEKMWDGDGWRDNAHLTNLPRAFINLGTIMPAWHQIASVHDPLPEWAAEADGLYTVWLTDDDAAPLDLEASHEVWLDYSDVRPVEGWDDESAADAVAVETPPSQDWCEAMAEAVAPTPTKIVRTPTLDDLKEWIVGLNLLKAEEVAYDEYDYYCQTCGMDSDERDAYNRYEYEARERNSWKNGLIDSAIKALNEIISPASETDESDLQSLVDSAGQIPPIEVG